jgi:hypothetical protein
MAAATLDHIERILEEPVPTVPELPEDPTPEELCTQYIVLARAYASEVLLNRQALQAFVKQLKRLEAKIDGSRP